MRVLSTLVAIVLASLSQAGLVSTHDAVRTYDEQAIQANAVDVNASDADQNITVSQFAAAVATAWDGNSGGVVNFDSFRNASGVTVTSGDIVTANGDTFAIKYGASLGKTLTVTMNGAGNLLTVATDSPQETSGINQVGSGPVSFGLSFSEPLRAFGITVLDRNDRALTLTLTLSNSTTVVIGPHTVGNGNGANADYDMFFGYQATANNGIVSVYFTNSNWNRYDDLGFILPVVDPSVQTLSPADNSTVPPPAALVATFDRNIQKNATGTITITNLTAHSADAIAIGSSQISVTPSNLTIAPTAPLADNTSYAVLISADAIKSTAGGSFAGYLTATNWNFTTTQRPAPAIGHIGGATNIAAGAATVKADLVSTGTSSTTVWVLYDTANRGTNSPSAWAYTNKTIAVPATQGVKSPTLALGSQTNWWYAFYATNASGAVWGGAPAWFNNNPVSVAPASASFYEDGGKGTFTVSRAAFATNGALTVGFTLGGTATNGVNYTTVSASTVQIPAGATVGRLVVTGKVDGTSNAHTLSLALNDDGRCVVGVPSSAEMVIANQDPTIIEYVSALMNTDGWRSSATNKPAGTDPNGDGALGSDGYWRYRAQGATSATGVRPAYISGAKGFASYAYNSYQVIDDPTLPIATSVANTNGFLGSHRWDLTADGYSRAFAFTNVGNYSSFLLTVIVDSATELPYTNRAPAQLRVAQTSGGAASATHGSVASPLQRNNVPDYYVFRIRNAMPGDVFQVQGDNTDPDSDVWVHGIAWEAIPAATGTLAFSSATYSQDEGNSGVTNVTITVTRTGGSAGAVSVGYATADGTATTDGNDYTAASGTLNWGDGDDLAKTFTVAVKGDTDIELSETVLLSLTNPQGGATLGTHSNATLTLLNDDSAAGGSLSFSAAAYEQVEGNGGSSNVTVTVTRTGGANGVVGVTYYTSNGTATEPGDYTLASNTLSWADQESGGKSFTVEVKGDTDSEPDETVNLILANLTGEVSAGAFMAATLTIVNDDKGVLSFSSATYSHAELKSGTTNATITVTRTGGAYSPVSVNYATANGTATQPDDYTLTAGTLNWASGDSSAKTFVVPIKGDTVAESGNETLSLALSNPTPGATLGTSAAVLEIVDAGLANVWLTISPSTALSEGGTATVTARLDAPAVSDVTVNLSFSGSALRPTDYACPASIVIPAGQLSKGETVSVVSGDGMEGSESFTIGIGSAVNATAVAPLSVTAIVLGQVPVNITYEGALMNTEAWRSTRIDKPFSIDPDMDGALGSDGYLVMQNTTNGVRSLPEYIDSAAILAVYTVVYGGVVNVPDNIDNATLPIAASVDNWGGDCVRGASGGDYAPLFSFTMRQAGDYVLTVLSDTEGAHPLYNVRSIRVRQTLGGSASCTIGDPVWLSRNGTPDCYGFLIDNADAGQTFVVEALSEQPDAVYMHGIAWEAVPPRGTLFIFR